MMMYPDVVRLATLILAVPSVALVFAFAIHLWTKATGDYRPVFRTGAIAYAGVGVLIAGNCWRTVDLFGEPLRPGVYLMLVGVAVLIVGMLGQFRYLPTRKW